MPIYKVVFARNTIISIQLVTKRARFDGEYHCEYDKGYPIYALVRAASEEDARAIAARIVLKAVAVQTAPPGNAGG